MRVLVWALAVLLIASPAYGMQGAVWKDPTTGKWVEVSPDQLKSDPRMRDERVSGDSGGDFFSFGSASDPIADSFAAPLEAKPIQTKSLSSRSSKYTAVKPILGHPLPPAPAVGQTTSRDFRQRSSKLSQELSLTANVQTDAHPTDEAANLVQEGASIESFVHLPQAAPAAARTNTLTTKNIGALCRYQGYAPLTGCPAEAANGCIDRIPCDRDCVVDGYFHYRCKGPHTATPEEVVPEATPEPTTESREEYVGELSARIQSAIEGGDYTALARLIVDAGASGATGLAANALAQMAQKHSTHH